MKVRITVTEETTYTDTVEMSSKDFRSYSKALEDH